MPVSLPPLNRRRWLLGSAAAGAGMMLPGLAAQSARGHAGQEGFNPHRFALFSDTHVAADKTKVHRGVNMYAQLRQAVEEVVAQEEASAAVFINGDCAFSRGERGDYAALIEALRPLRQAGLPIHCGLGNHDDRTQFRESMPAEPDAQNAFRPKHAAVAPSERANWFVLDSLDRVNTTPGLLGEEQLAWLARALDDRADRPAMVLMHHNPQQEGDPPRGLLDADALFKILIPRRHVKAVIWGHTHCWHNYEREGIHCINLPPTAYVFSNLFPSGWVDAQLEPRGAKFTLHTIDKNQQRNGHTLELDWRT